MYNVYLISDSTGETLDRIFLALQAQFDNFKYHINHFSFTRTNNQIDKILLNCENNENSIILYTIVDEQLAKYLSENASRKKIPCFEILGDLISNFSKVLNKKATHKPSGQHALDEEYYKRIEAIQFTMEHDDGKNFSNIEDSDIILLGISRTSKTPTSIYLANRGYKTSNIPIINNSSLPNEIIKNPKISCIIGLVTEPARLVEVRKNRMSSLHEDRKNSYTDVDSINLELELSKNIFKKHGWPIIDVTRKSVEEIAASIIKIFDIINAK